MSRSLWSTCATKISVDFSLAFNTLQALVVEQQLVGLLGAARLCAIVYLQRSSVKVW